MLTSNIARGKDMGGGRGEEDPASWEPWVVGVKGTGSEAESPHPSQWGHKMQPTQAKPPSLSSLEGKAQVTGSRARA